MSLGAGGAPASVDEFRTALGNPTVDETWHAIHRLHPNGLLALGAIELLTPSITPAEWTHDSGTAHNSSLPGEIVNTCGRLP